MKTNQAFSIQTWRSGRGLNRQTGVLLAFLLLSRAAFAANGTTLYLDVNGTTAGFGSPNGNSYSQTGAYWSTDITGVAAPGAFVSVDAMQFDKAGGTDFSGSTFSVNLDAGNDVNGITVSNASCNITLFGTSNTHPTSSSTWSVIAGSTLTMASTRQAPGGLNMNSQTITISGGGTFNFGTGMGCNSSALITENMPGGVLNLQETNLSATGYVSTYSGGFTLTAGTLNFGSAQSAFSFADFAAGKAFSINGGTVDNTSGSAMTLATITNGGGITLGGNFTFAGSSSLNLGPTAANLTGSRTITVNANTLTMAGAITNAAGSAFSLTKAGAGTLALTGANTYTGLTTVAAGKLITTTAAAGGGSYSNANSATLDVQAAAAGQSLNTGLLALGATGPCSLQIDTGAFGNPTAPFINATNLAVNGAVTVNLFGSALTTGTFTILTNSPGLRTGSGSFTLSASPRLHATLNDDTANNRVTITITSTPDTFIAWNGVASGNWDINDGANNTWKTGVSGTPTDYTEDPVNGNDTVQFTDGAAGTTNVNLTTILSPNGVTVSNTTATATANYTFSGTGRVAGTTGLTKLGTGELTLAESGGDSFSGGITAGGGTLVLDDAGSTISGGTVISNAATLQIGNADANGSLPAGNIVDNGALTISQTLNTTINTTIPGTGNLIKNSSGILTLGAVNTYSGGTTVNGGTLQVRGNGGNTSLGSGDVTVNAGGILIGTNADAFGYSGHTNPANIYITGGIVSDLGSSSYRITLPNLIFTGGLLTNDPANGGDAFGNYSLNGNGGAATVTTLASSSTAIIGASAISPQNSTTFVVASGSTPSGIDLLIASAIETYNGISRTVTKTGSGVMAWSGANSYIGNTVISNGTLALMGSASLASPQIGVTNGAKFDVSQLSSPFSVNTSQTLGGNGLVAGNVNTAYASVIDAGLYGGSTLSFANNLVCGYGSTNHFVLSATLPGANSKIAVAGTLDLTAGGIVVQLNYTTLQNGRYTLFTYGSLAGGAADLILGGYTAGGRQSAVLDDSIPGEIDLVVSGVAGNLTWQGDGINNNWDVNTTQDWSNNVSHLTDFYFDGDVVAFNDFGSKSPAVNLPGTVQPASILVANNSGVYTFSDTGAGKITGTTVLLKQGNGGLALMESGGDDFSGGITVGGGSLILSNNNVNVSGGITVTNGSVVVAQSGTITGGLTMNNAAGGSPVAQIIASGTLNGNITVAGNLTISNTPTITGNLNVTNGLTLLDEDTVPTGNGTVASGAVIEVGNNDESGNLPSGTMTMNGTLTFNRLDDFNIAKVIAGAATGSLLKSNLDTLTLSGANTFTGAVTVAVGILKVANAAALGKNTVGTTVLPGATLDVNGIVIGAEPITVSGIGTTNNDGSTNGAINNSSGTAATPALNFITLTGDTVFGATSGRWDLGAPAGPNSDPSGAQLGTGGQPDRLIKVGSQFFGLRAVTVDPQLGDVDVQAGTFNIEGNTTGLGNSSSNLFVRNGATLEVYNMTNQLNKQIKLDDNATVLNGAGTNTVIGPITLAGSSDTFSVNAGLLTLNGVLSGAGALTKTGTNVLVLTAANSYTGDTTISAGTLALTGVGSISGGGQVTLNTANLDVSKKGSGFALTPNTLTGNSGSVLIFSNAAPATVGTFNLNDSTLIMQVANAGAAGISAGTLNFGGNSNLVSVTVLGTPTQLQFPLIKYTSCTGFNIGVSNILPAAAGYLGFISNNVANSSIDFVITGSGASVAWNGGHSAVDNDWSDALNWTMALQPGNNIFFGGTAGLVNTNDTVAGTVYSGITFNAGSGAFVLNGNPITLTGNVTNNSANPQTINLGMSYGNNLVLNGAAAPLVISGLTNTASTGVLTVTLDGTGTLTNLLNSTSTGTNILTLNAAGANWTNVDNGSSAAITLPAASLNIIGGSTFSFGAGNSAPSLTVLGGSGTDNTVGNTTGTSTFNMVNGTLTLPVRLNTSGNGNINVFGGTLNVAAQMQNANGASTDVSVVNVFGGTLNIGTVTSPGSATWDVGSRGTTTVNLAGGLAECGILDVSRNATTPSVGVVNLNGGTLVCSRVSTVTHNASTNSTTGTTATVNFNGGLLKANATSATFLQGGTVVGATTSWYVPVNAVVKAGGAMIDANGHAISIVDPLLHDASLGAAPDGGLVVTNSSGTGVLTLNATNTYTGNTIINAGTLALGATGSISNSPNITIAAGAILDASAQTGGTLALVSQSLGGSGSVTGTLVADANSLVAPGSATDIGALTVSANTSLNGTNLFKLNKSVSPSNDVLNVTGTVTYGGALKVSNIGGALAVGDSFQLFAAATYAGSFSATNLPAAGSGLAWSWNPANGTLSVIPGAPSNPSITSTIVGSALTLSWPAGDIGWTLQCQTNTLGQGLNPSPTAWIPVPGTSGVDTYNITIDPKQPAVFYRLQN